MKDDSVANIESSLPSLDGDAAIELCLQAVDIVREFLAKTANDDVLDK
jgi:hypothetical protein